MLRWTPRRNCWSVSAANQRSTRLIHDAPVGVKGTWNRGWRASQRWISGVLCVRDQVDLERRRHGRLNGVEELAELLRPLPPGNSPITGPVLTFNAAKSEVGP